MFDDYYYYATAIIIISFGSILISVYQTKKVVLKGLEIIEYLKEGKRKTQEKRREVRMKKEKEVER